MKLLIRLFENKKIVLITLSILALASAYLLDWSTHKFALHITNVTMTSASEGKTTNTIPVTLPFLQDSGAISNEYVFTGLLEYYPFYPTVLKIIPDDNFKTLKINGLEVSLAGISPEKLSDWVNGFEIDIGKYLKVGSNQIEFLVMDLGAGKYGLDAYNPGPFHSFISFIFFILFLIFSMAFFYFALEALGFDFKVRLIFITALFVFIMNLVHTRYDRYTYDLLEGDSGHLNYVEYIVKNNALPSPDGWVFYHPPLYYLSAAAVYKVCQLIGVNFIYKALQGLSLFYFFTFLIFGALILKRLISKSSLFYLSIFLLVFWPSGFIHSIRIGNDVLFCTLFTAGLFYLYRWRETKEWKYLYMASLFASLDFMTKTNGLILIMVLFILLLIEYFKYKDKIVFLKKASMVLGMLILAFVLSTYDNYIMAIQQKRPNWILAGIINVTASEDPALYVENKLINYVYFDPATYFTSPFVDTRDNRTGRQYFWNFLLKSSLFGEFSFSSSLKRGIALFLSYLLFGMLIYFLAGLVFWVMMMRDRSLPIRESYRNPMVFSLCGDLNSTYRVRHIKRYKFPLLVKVELVRRHFFSRYKAKDFGMLLLSLLFFILLMLAYRINKPLSPLSDFRYIYPAIITFCTLYCFSLEVFKDRHKETLVMIGYIMAISFSALSGLFFLL